MAIQYTTSLDTLHADHLTGGFFVDWPNPPAPEAHLRILQGSYRVWLARDEAQVVGFVTAISDGVLTAFIPLLEVLPAYQAQGIGAELMRRMLASLGHLYSIDLMCDDDLVAFYQRLGMQALGGMGTRNYDYQSGDHSE